MHFRKRRIWALQQEGGGKGSKERLTGMDTAASVLCTELCYVCIKYILYGKLYFDLNPILMMYELRLGNFWYVYAV